jgi:membrane associated rhomboid family serine protease
MTATTPPAAVWEGVDPFPDRPDAVRRRGHIWALVLEARGVPHRLHVTGDRLALFVPPAKRAQAEAEIRCYEAENRLWPRSRPAAPSLPRNERRTFLVLVLLGLFHDLTFQPPGTVLGIAVDWHRLGSMDSARVLEGEWWRLVTALTLHADGLHLAGNLVLGGILLALLNRQLGVGLGVALSLCAGTLGNLANALIRGPGHLSVGASTAVFGALGALVARSATAAGRRDWRRWVVPLGAGAGLIALVGVGGERTDYLAHLLGFAAGAVLGVPTRGFRSGSAQRPRWVSWAGGFAAAGAVVGSWALAINCG